MVQPKHNIALAYACTITHDKNSLKVGMAPISIKGPIMGWRLTIDHTKSIAAIKVATMKKYRLFIVWKESSHTKSIPFAVSKGLWNTKGDTGKSMNNALCVLQYAKRLISGWSKIQQWESQACRFSHCWVTLVWKSASRSVSQLVGQQSVGLSTLPHEAGFLVMLLRIMLYYC